MGYSVDYVLCRCTHHERIGPEDLSKTCLAPGAKPVIALMVNNCSHCYEGLLADKKILVEENQRLLGSGIPRNALCFFMDGDKWCCVFGDFRNLQVSQAGFGSNKEEALDALTKGGQSDHLIRPT